MPTYTWLRVGLRKPEHGRLATLSLIDLTIGNNTTADSATVSTYRISSVHRGRSGLLTLAKMEIICLIWYLTK